MKGATCIVLLAVGIVAVAAQEILPSFACTSNNDCAPGYCCVEHMERYAEPSCVRRRQEGEVCRVGGPVRRNNTLYFPDGSQIKTNQAYVSLCPCDVGLTCDRDTSVCADSTHVNSIAEEQASKHDD